jgi:hypothetical protein
MLFAIDDAKVTELLESSRSLYELSGSPLVMGSENYKREPIYPDLPVGGTVPAGSGEHLFLLRSKIEMSGTPLISAEDLEAEIREMRR